MTKGHWINYSARELKWIQLHKRLPRRLAHAEFCKAFRRRDVNLENYKDICLRNGWSTGRTGCYPKGNVPANKGKKMPFNANSARTQFKKGQLPHNVKHLGHERLSKDGYVEISIAERNPHTGFERRYVLKHKHLWEQKHGKVPKGMCLKCLDGDKTNTDPANWELITRAVLVRLNDRQRRFDYDKAPAKLKPAILTIAKLRTKAKRLRKS